MALGATASSGNARQALMHYRNVCPALSQLHSVAARRVRNYGKLCVAVGKATMFLRAAPFFAMLITLLLLAACEASPPSSTPPHTPTPAPEYLAEEIPPCMPAAGSPVDPCEPDLLWSDGAGIYGIGSEPRGLRLFLGDGSYGWASLTHLVVRGAFLPGAVRCTSEGDLFRPPSYLDVSWFLQSNTKSIKCYADMRVNAYVLGSGPPTLTVIV